MVVLERVSVSVQAFKLDRLDQEASMHCCHPDTPVCQWRLKPRDIININLSGFKLKASDVAARRSDVRTIEEPKVRHFRFF